MPTPRVTKKVEYKINNLEWRDNQKQSVLFACAYQFGDQYKDDVAICVYIQVNIHKGQIIQLGLFLDIQHF